MGNELVILQSQDMSGMCKKVLPAGKHFPLILSLTWLANSSMNQGAISRTNRQTASFAPALRGASALNP